MKPALLAAIVLCAILTGCKKEDTAENPAPKATRKSSTNATGLFTEDRPKRPKGKIRNNAMFDIAGADIYLCTVNDSNLVDSAITDVYGAFGSDNEITAGEYYVVVQASGYEPNAVSFTVPLSLETEFDIGTIVLQPAE